MIEQMSNIVWKGVPVPLIEIELRTCSVSVETDKGLTYHKVFTVSLENSVEVRREFMEGKLPFDYQGGNIKTEGMQAIKDYIASPQVGV